MKKLISLVTVLTLSLCLLAACGNSPAATDLTLRIGGLKGPTSMGMVKLLKDAQEGVSVNQYEYTLAGSADELTPKLLNGELDFAAIPANLASVLFHNSEGAVQLLAINTLGVLYLVENGETVQTLEDLRGMTLYATGKGSIPEYTLRYILQENGIDPDTDVTIEFKSEPSEIVAMMAQGQSVVAMMPQPYVTVAQNTVEGLRMVADLTAEWDALDNGSALITGVLVVRTAFAAEHPEAVAAFLTEYKASTQYINDHIEEGAVLVEEFDIVKAAIAQKAIPACNITYIDGNDMKALMRGYLEVLYNQNPKAVGDALPGDDFYYGAN